MNPIYFAAKNSWVTFFREADKGGGSGGGGKPQTVPELTQKVTLLEGEKQKLEGDLKAETQKVTTLEGEKQKLESDLKAEKQRADGLDAEKQKLEGDLKTEKQRADDLHAKHAESEKQLALAREQNARFGGTPPERHDGGKKEGEKQEGTEDKNLTPAQKLANWMAEGK